MLLRFVHSFNSTAPTYSARFDGKGNRLICVSKEEQVVYNVPANEVTDKVQLNAPGYSVSKDGCFAGDDDELVVAPSFDHRLFIWSVPEGQGDRTIDQPLLSLPGHHGHEINQVRYCKATSSLVSGVVGGVIKLWTPSTISR